jgi:hypothetical protein
VISENRHFFFNFTVKQQLLSLFLQGRARLRPRRDEVEQILRAARTEPRSPPERQIITVMPKK